jgi:glycosyltransferase involved in cell wall biosynthesis
MACGTPSVVASPVFKDVFGDYAVDFIFSGESAADLALRMQRAIETSPSGYRAISEALRTAIMARYSLQSFCRRLIHALYAAGAGRK